MTTPRDEFAALWESPDEDDEDWLPQPDPDDVCPECGMTLDDNRACPLCGKHIPNRY